MKHHVSVIVEGGLIVKTYPASIDQIAELVSTNAAGHQAASQSLYNMLDDRYRTGHYIELCGVNIGRAIPCRPATYTNIKLTLLELTQFCNIASQSAEQSEIGILADGAYHFDDLQNINHNDI